MPRHRRCPQSNNYSPKSPTARSLPPVKIRNSGFHTALPRPRPLKNPVPKYFSLFLAGIYVGNSRNSGRFVHSSFCERAPFLYLKLCYKLVKVTWHDAPSPSPDVGLNKYPRIRCNFDKFETVGEPCVNTSSYVSVCVCVCVQ